MRSHLPSRVHPVIIAFALVAALNVTPATASGELADRATVATSAAAGSTLSVVPEIAFQQGTLRVSGPDGYEAIGWSEGGPLTLDLLADGLISDSDGRTGGRPEVLPDGHYSYEMTLHLSDGSRRSHGGFFEVANGSAQRLRRETRAVPTPSPTASAEVDDGLKNVSAAGTFTDDFVEVRDNEEDGRTYLHLRSSTAANQVGTSFWLENHGGRFHVSNIHTTINPILTVAPTDASDGRVGIGTQFPQADLHIFNPAGNIRITDADPCPNPNAAWEIEEDFGRLLFEVVPNCSGDAVGGKMWIHGNGNVGIGTNNPLARLHVIGGGIIEGDVAFGSSRTIKHEIEPLDTAEVLQAIRELPLYSWKYREDPIQAPHVGPMAEDVHGIFELGRDERHLSPADSAGLALAGVQGVDRRVAELEATVTALASRNDTLSAENRTLEERLAALERRLETVTDDSAPSPRPQPGMD